MLAEDRRTCPRVTDLGEDPKRDVLKWELEDIIGTWDCLRLHKKGHAVRFWSAPFALPAWRAV